MAKSSRRVQQQAKPLPPINHLLSTKPTFPQTFTGNDITKPRDLYTFLSLGHIPFNSVQWTQRESLANRPDDNKKVKFSHSTIASSTRQWDDNLSQNSYLQFDAHNPITGLPVLPAITRVSSESCEEGDEGLSDIDDDTEEPVIVVDNTPRKSIINEEDHKIKIQTTYIFAPDERLHETVKYTKNVSLPKIKHKKRGIGDTTQRHTNTTISVTNQNSGNATSKSDAIETYNLSPRKQEMHSGNYLFGVRPECIFMTNQLGVRNPLLKQNKDNPPRVVLKPGTGMNDLKDYEGYPEAYWELRDGTIAHPEDLEADMIDRDLYRLRQISSLKLNTIKRTFQVTHDPFRKWRGKSVEPVFSPRQQIRPCNRLRKEKVKLVDIPIYPQHMSKPGNHETRISRLRLTNEDKVTDNIPLSSSREIKNHQQETVPTSEKKELDISVVGIQKETPESITEETPREMLAASLDTYRKLEEEREEKMKSDDLSIQKLHQLKGKREKKPIKTSLIQVDMEKLEAYKNDPRVASNRKLPELQTGRSLNNNVNREHVAHMANRDAISLKINMTSEVNPGKTAEDDTVLNGSKDSTGNRRKISDNNGTKQPIKAPVASILFKPHHERQTSEFEHANENGVMGNNAYFVDWKTGLASSIHSDGSIACRDRHKTGNASSLRPVHLEVFAERKDPRSPIKIPTGRTTYHPHLPSCRFVDIL